MLCYTPGLVPCLTQCCAWPYVSGAEISLCWGRHWKVAGMKGGGRREEEQLIAMVTSIFTKFFTSIWLHLQPFHLAEGGNVP